MTSIFFFHKRGPLWSTVSDFFSLPLLKDWMELRRALLPTPLALGGERDGGTGSIPGGGGGGAAGGRGGAGGAPADPGRGVGEDGQVGGELAPEPAELLLYLTERSSSVSYVDCLDFFLAKIFLFLFSSSEPW